jgi:hypothetical protein
MNCRILAFWVICLTFGRGVSAAAKPTTFDLVGRWDGALEIGKERVRLQLRIARSTDGRRVEVSIDVPDQGQKDIPVPALLYHPPDIRIEIDMFRTTFTGVVSEDGKSIVGQFLEGPGGRPAPLTFHRSAMADAPEPVRSFSFATGEALDIRGYWRGEVESQPGDLSPIGLRIGRLPDGAFEVTMDDFEHGATDVSATRVETTNGVTRIDWKLFRLTFEGKLAADGRELKGQWKMGPKTTTVTFKRLNQPATTFPEGTSFVPGTQLPSSIRGDWKGTLNVGDQKLRLVFKLGQLPDGSFAGSMASVDQGKRPLVASRVTFTDSVLRVDCKVIHGTYTGTLNSTHTEFEGRWEQGNANFPLNLSRSVPAADTATSSKPAPDR